MNKDIERELKYIHCRISANSKSSHIAILCVQQMLEVLASDFNNEDRGTAFRSIITNSQNSLALANKEIKEMNDHFRDVIDSNDKHDSETKH